MSFFSLFSSSTPVNGANSANSGSAPQTSTTANNSVSTSTLKTIKQQSKIAATETSSNTKTLNLPKNIDIEPSLTGKLIGPLVLGTAGILGYFFGVPVTEEHMDFWLSHYGTHYYP